jgi:cell division protein FtsQ
LDSGVDVQLPDQDEARALQRLLVLEEEHRLFARDISIIDLRDPDRLYVRLNSDKVLKFEGAGLET